MEEILAARRPGGRNALIAAGDSMTADILLKALKVCQFGSVFVVNECAEALRAIDDACEPVDVFIVDIRLADGDAFQTISYLAERRFAGALVFITDGAPVLLNCAADLAESGGLRVLGTFERPISIRTLIDLLNRYLLESAAEPRGERRIDVDPAVIDRDLANWKIEAAFQPKVSLTSGEIAGFEALARWNHPEYGLMPPAYFLSRAEQNSLIDDLTVEMLRQSMTVLTELSALVPRAKMSVNLSGGSLTDPELPDRLLAIVEEHGIRPSQVIFEITETQIVRNRVNAVSNVNRLGLMGFGISLDDFGTGFSSLDRLKCMPFTELKVDRQFCHGAAERPQLVHILKTCHHLARELGLLLVAEGVEKEADRQLVRELGFDVVQGFCVSAAIPARRLANWIELYNLDRSSEHGLVEPGPDRRRTQGASP